MLKNVKMISLIFAAALVVISMAIPAMAEAVAEGSAPVVAQVAEEAAAHTEHHGGGLPQFNTATWPSQIFWLTIFFSILYFAFSKFVLPALGGTIEARANYIGDNIKKAEMLSSEAETLRSEIQDAMKVAGQKANTEITNAINQTKAHLDAAVNEFRSHQESEIAATESRIQSATHAAMADMQSIAASLAAQAAEKIAGIPASESGAEGVVKSLSQKSKLAA